jgi:DNA primase
MRAGLDPRIVELPEDLDPDDWVRSEGPEPFNRAVDNALPLLEFHHRHFSGDLTTTGDLHRFIETALRELAPIRDRLVRDLNIKQLAELSGVDERRLHETMQTLPRLSNRQDEAQAAPARAAIIEPTRSHKAQMALIRLAFQEHEDVLNLLVDEVTPELFLHPVLRQIWDLAGPMLKAGTIPEASQIMSRLPDPSIQQLLSAMLMEDDRETDRLALAIDCLTRLYRDQLESRIEARRRDLKAAEKATGSPPPELLQEWTDLNQSLAELGHHFDKYRA